MVATESPAEALLLLLRRHLGNRLLPASAGHVICPSLSEEPHQRVHRKIDHKPEIPRHHRHLKNDGIHSRVLERGSRHNGCLLYEGLDPKHQGLKLHLILWYRGYHSPRGFWTGNGLDPVSILRNVQNPLV
ncbi:hypothetical protein NDU88_000634 [Pleurodeles waltl]|uniref:Uncharacterized protein n=1 Tax=Pleurodeles waltl TaxID=8319 RepID=A0AAV7LW36_PLEWA|nr:hypothetical protein NDU88_000634 [Pleurodeles waltl]